MKTENYTGIGAILSSLLIASCCIGPAVFVIFGTSLSFLGWFSVFEPYQGYFMAIAAVLLSVSFWKLYLKKSDCDYDENDTRINFISKVIFWIGLAFFIIAISLPRVLLLIYG
jgi:mercuric ion transport protein